MRPWLRSVYVGLERFAQRGVLFGTDGGERIRMLMPDLKERAKTLEELAGAALFAVHEGAPPMEAKAAALLDTKQALTDRIPYAGAIIALSMLILLFLFTGGLVVPIDGFETGRSPSLQSFILRPADVPGGATVVQDAFEGEFAEGLR